MTSGRDDNPFDSKNNFYRKYSFSLHSGASGSLNGVVYPPQDPNCPSPDLNEFPAGLNTSDNKKDEDNELETKDSYFEKKEESYNSFSKNSLEETKESAEKIRALIAKNKDNKRIVEEKEIEKTDYSEWPEELKKYDLSRFLLVSYNILDEKEKKDKYVVRKFLERAEGYKWSSNKKMLQEVLQTNTKPEKDRRNNNDQKIKDIFFLSLIMENIYQNFLNECNHKLLGTDDKIKETVIGVALDNVGNGKPYLLQKLEKHAEGLLKKIISTEVSSNKNGDTKQDIVTLQSALNNISLNKDNIEVKNSQEVTENKKIFYDISLSWGVNEFCIRVPQSTTNFNKSVNASMDKISNILRNSGVGGVWKSILGGARIEDLIAVLKKRKVLAGLPSGNEVLSSVEVMLKLVLKKIQQIENKEIFIGSSSLSDFYNIYINNVSPPHSDEKNIEENPTLLTKPMNEEEAFFNLPSSLKNQRILDTVYFFLRPGHTVNYVIRTSNGYNCKNSVTTIQDFGMLLNTINFFNEFCKPGNAWHAGFGEHGSVHRNGKKLKKLWGERLGSEDILGSIGKTLYNKLVESIKVLDELEKNERQPYLDCAHKLIKEKPAFIKVNFKNLSYKNESPIIGEKARDLHKQTVKVNYNNSPPKLLDLFSPIQKTVPDYKKTTGLSSRSSTSFYGPMPNLEYY